MPKILFKMLPIVLIAFIGLSFVFAPFVQAQTTSGPVQEKKPLFPTIEKLEKEIEKKTGVKIDVGQTITQQQDQEGKTEEVGTFCNPFKPWKFNPKICLAEILANTGNAMLWFTGLALDVTENLFNTTIHYNLDTSTFDPQQKNIIKDGWTFLRNTANLFFIFILLIIAIAVIIGWETYGIKSALPTLIIIVLLINFSLLFTRYIIEFSNSFAQYFYEGMVGPYDSKRPFEISTLFHKGLTTWDVLETYKKEEVERKTAGKEREKIESEIKRLESGLTKEGFFRELSKKQKEERKQEIENLQTKLNRLNASPEALPRVQENIFKTIAFSTLFGVVVLLVAAFVFFAIGVLLLLRIVMLWFAMILAPGALLLWTLPATSGYGKKWLTFLFNQALFFPVLLFFLSITTVFITGESFNFTKQTGDVISGVVQNMDASLVSKAAAGEGFLFNYGLVVMMLIASLWFAKSMSAYGADMVYGWGGKVKDTAMGVAKRTATLGPGLLWKRGIEKLEEKSLGKGTGAKIAGAFMGAGKAARYIATGKTPEEDKEDIKRRFMKYNVGDLPDMYLKASGKTRAAIAERYKDEMGVSIKTAMKPSGPTTGGWGSGIISRMLKRGLGIAPKTSTKEGESKKTAEGGHGGGEYDADKEEWEKRK